jgi:GNAT superfamily N-acetyltransferase
MHKIERKREMSIIRELDAQETYLAYPTLLELRPHLRSRDEFVHQVEEYQRSEGYRLVGSFEDGADEPVAVAGFRTGHNLALQYYLYVDDLVTQAAFQGRGHAGRLMQWLVEEARRLGCAHLHLDSGVQRHDAHRLYLNQRMRISAHHFQYEL